MVAIPSTETHERLPLGLRHEGLGDVVLADGVVEGEAALLLDRHVLDVGRDAGGV